MLTRLRICPLVPWLGLLTLLYKSTVRQANAATAGKTGI